MYRNLTISLVIPAYNEEKGLPFVLEKAPDFLDEIIIVDNNSTDLTANIGERFGARVFRETRQGYGHAYFKGLAEATGEVIVTLDGDGTYPVDRIQFLVDQLIDEQLEFISACRFPLMEAKNMDPVSKFGNFVLTLTTRILFGYRLKDSQSGMWVFYRSILPKLTLKNTGMGFSEEIKIEAIRRNLKFREVHIPYYERYGEKKIKKFQDGIKNLIWLWRLRFRK